jgi:hypothetical protein
LLSIVLPKYAIGGNHGQLFDLRLRNEQTVERIAMMRRQIKHAVRVL